VKEAVLPFKKFAGIDTILELNALNWEVMGIDMDFGAAYAKAELRKASQRLPLSGTVFVSMSDPQNLLLFLWLRI
jgi:hypothetical protein